MGQWERKGCEDETVGPWQAGSMGGWEEESMGGWEDERTGSKREEGNGKDGERKQAKPYTTIPSRGFAPGKLPLDRPHQGAAMLRVQGPSPWSAYKGWVQILHSTVHAARKN